MQITIDIPDDVARRIEDHIADATSDFNSHGPLTLQKLMDMVAEDVGMSVTRPGSWEGANMRDVIAAHGYPGERRVRGYTVIERGLIA